MHQKISHISSLTDFYITCIINVFYANDLLLHRIQRTAVGLKSNKMRAGNNQSIVLWNSRIDSVNLISQDYASRGLKVLHFQLDD